MARKIIIAYIPAIHQGYRSFLEANPAYHSLYILDKSFTDTFRHLQKEIRALEPTLVRQALIGWNILDDIHVANEATLRELQRQDVDILLPDEDISYTVRSRFFADKKVSFSPVFLRWDRRKSNAKQPIDPDIVISEDELTGEVLLQAHQEGLKSSNIWRRVGAVLVKNKEVIAYSSNQHRPSAHSPWIDGDVRANFKRGVGIEMSTDQHAESCVIAEAARQGVELEGADLYVTTFPCPPCAMLIAYAGIKRLFYAEGYAVLDGMRVLRDKNVAIFKANIKLPEDDEALYVAYPEKSRTE